ncbi:MAG: GDSL-type esterase/lipase family protein [Cyclobacterium sp.]|uniref:GDSL-type esterase/lipase family protein n=1 Tax=Cyclobacterium sp. TaxID=1966343 RepID=UPI003970C5D1
MYRITIFLFLLLSYSSSLFAQASFDPKEGDRIIYLGNSLMENEQQYGFLEYLISSNHPEKHLSFRNLGWSGDTVFGEARSYYTSPPGPFDLLISQIRATRADWAFLAYGTVEAQNGSKGLDEFEQGLSRLLDSLEAMDTRALIISTIPQLLMNGAEQSDQHLSNLKAYNQSMSRIAAERNLAFIDVYGPIEREQSADIWESNRVHLNQNGYLLFTQTMGEEMGLQLYPSDILINIKTNTLTSDHQAELLAADPGNGQLQFALNGSVLPHLNAQTLFQGPKISIQGLKKGYYQLFMDGQLLAVADHRTWNDGLFIDLSSAGKQMLDLIREKDQIYFQQYRPQNRTYILGFRSYEQGRHKAGLESLDALIFWLDGKINRSKDLKEQLFTLEPLR